MKNHDFLFWERGKGKGEKGKGKEELRLRRTENCILHCALLTLKVNYVKINS